MTDPSSQHLIICPGHANRHYWRDLWHHRELLYYLAWRDILVRYKQTAIGISWALLRPMLTVVVFTIVFGMLAGLPSGDIPYPVLVLCALLPWQFFANALSESGHSIINNAGMISKIYFPRLIIPFSTVAVSLVDFLVSAAILAGLMVWYGLAPDWRIFAAPFFLLVALCASLGAGLWVAALNVKYRDFRFVVPVILQLGLYLSPVGFSSDIVPEKWRLLYSLNPMAGVIDGFRWAVLGGNVQPHWPGLLLSTGLAFVLLLSGILFFRKVEKSFADVI